MSEMEVKMVKGSLKNIQNGRKWKGGYNFSEVGAGWKIMFSDQNIWTLEYSIIKTAVFVVKSVFWQSHDLF